MDNPFVTKGYAGPEYHLHTASVVTAATRSLLEKDFITQTKDAYTVYDPFFARWLKEKY